MKSALQKLEKEKIVILVGHNHSTQQMNLLNETIIGKDNIDVKIIGDGKELLDPEILNDELNNCHLLILAHGRIDKGHYFISLFTKEKEANLASLNKILQKIKDNNVRIKSCSLYSCYSGHSLSEIGKLDNFSLILSGSRHASFIIENIRQINLFLEFLNEQSELQSESDQDFPQTDYIKEFAIKKPYPETRIVVLKHHTRINNMEVKAIKIAYKPEKTKGELIGKVNKFYHNGWIITCYGQDKDDANKEVEIPQIEQEDIEEIFGKDFFNNLTKATNEQNFKDGVIAIAAGRGKLERIKTLETYFKISGNQKSSPLSVASQNGYLEIVKFLIDNGSDVNQIDCDGSTPLSVAAQDGHLEVVKFLIDKEADINQTGHDGRTPLSIAAQNGHLKVVELLIDKGADISQIDYDGYTPLLLASCNGHLKVVELLIDKGANINQIGCNKSTPLWIASQNGHLKVVELLIDKGANINQANSYKCTPLFIAAQCRHLKVVELLINKEADINQANNYGFTPLFIAAQCGHLEIVQFLIEKEAKVNIVDNLGNTALLIALYNQNLEMVRLLIDNGSDVNQANTNDPSITPLSVASMSENQEIRNSLVNLLYNGGDNMNTYSIRPLQNLGTVPRASIAQPAVAEAGCNQPKYIIK